jgi:hypothetical protein
LTDKHVEQESQGYVCYWENCRRHRKPFLKRIRLINHFRTHSGEKPYVCPVEGCNKRFGRADALKTHALVHTRTKPHLCEIGDCRRAFYHQRSLVKHQAEIHQLRKRRRTEPPVSQSTHINVATRPTSSMDTVPIVPQQQPTQGMATAMFSAFTHLAVPGSLNRPSDT